MKDPRQSNAQESTVVLVCRDIELKGRDRREIERSEAAFAHVFSKIHRIEWTVAARPRSVEVRTRVHTRGGDFEARGAGDDARTAFQVVTRKILAQKRSQKEALLGSRREREPHVPSLDWY